MAHGAIKHTLTGVCCVVSQLEPCKCLALVGVFLCDRVACLLSTNQMEEETEERHRREVEAAQSGSSKAAPDHADEREEIRDDVQGGDLDGGVEKAEEGLGELSVEDKEKEKRDQKRAKAQRKREKQREKVDVVV